ncbi:virulence protein [Ileibacterium valens]|uniref:virulence protein n=1 Tax=Ileibacterium valens TaxID=1862668 RepID=UPI0024BAECCD|nr:virulence protein [Ileibacterium valens]
MMKIDYNVTGEQRKKLVEAISKATGFKPKYLKLPTLGYQVGPYFISKDGIVEVDENEPTVDDVMNAAVLAGFIGNVETGPEQEETFIGTVTITKDGMTPAMVENLKKIIDGKSALIKKAFGVEDLSLKENESEITFDWFPGMNPDNGPACIEFVAALRKMAMEAKRVTMTSKDVENEKYAWRCFLLRLGFIGPEYKKTRKILTKNFTGSSAFKNKKDVPNA